MEKMIEKLIKNTSRLSHRKLCGRRLKHSNDAQMMTRVVDGKIDQLFIIAYMKNAADRIIDLVCWTYDFDSKTWRATDQYGGELTEQDEKLIKTRIKNHDDLLEVDVLELFPHYSDEELVIAKLKYS